MNLRRLVLGLVLGWVGLGAAVFQTAPGRFEVIAADAEVARLVTGEAEAAWSHLAGPLSLPAGFSSPVFVRVIAARDWRDAAAFRVVVEPGGIVSLRIGWPEAGPPRWLDRALVQGLLLRLAVAHHGVTDRLSAPLWLELGCVGWWRTQAEGAQLDLLKHESRTLPPPRLDQLLSWNRGGPEPAGGERAATWLLIFLHGESPRGQEWAGLLRRLLRGEEPGGALGAAYPQRFTDAADRELWWQTGYHQLRRARSGPMLDPAESAAALRRLQRFVVQQRGAEAVLPLPDALAQAGRPFLAEEMEQRSAELGRLVAILHPFYRNAGLTLADLLAARGEPARHAALLAAWMRDWTDAEELAAESTRVLDAWEARRKGP